MIFDTHAHYDDEAFDEDRYELLEAMPKCGVGRIMNCGSSMATSRTTIELTKKYDFVYGCVGIHPAEIEGLTESDFAQLETWTKLPKIRGIGEIGLDYHYEPKAAEGETDAEREIREAAILADRAAQRAVFIRQLDMALRLDMPVVVHSRDAAADTMEVLKNYAGKLTVDIHCYSYSPEQAAEYVDMGFYIGIGGTSTFSNAKKVKRVAAGIPLERILLETDCPYLSPSPHRGERNNSSRLKYVVDNLAVLRGTTPSEIEKQTWENACRFYRLEV